MQLQAKRFGHGFARKVIFGGTESADEDDDVGTPHGQFRRGGEIVTVVADDAFEAHFDSQLVQFVGEIERVGVLPVGREHLRAHGNGFGVHG